MTAIAVPILLVVGALLAVQAAANVQMSTTMRSPLGAATLQLGLAAALLLLAATMAGSVVGVDALSAVPAWHLLGGLGSAVYITAGILLLPRLGAVVTVGSFIAGQMLASLVLDSAGLLGVPTEPIGTATALGALAVFVGAGLIVRAQTRAAVVPPRPLPPGSVAGPARRRRPGRGRWGAAGGAPAGSRSVWSAARSFPSRGDQRVAACGPRPAARGGRDLVPGGDRRDGRRARRGCGSPARPHHSWADSVRCPGGGARRTCRRGVRHRGLPAAPAGRRRTRDRPHRRRPAARRPRRRPVRPVAATASVSAPRLLGIAVLLVGVGLLQLAWRDRSSRHPVSASSSGARARTPPG